MKKNGNGPRFYGVEEGQSRKREEERKKNNRISAVLLVLALLFAIVAGILLLIDPIKNRMRKKEVEVQIEQVEKLILQPDVTEYTIVVSKDANKVNGEDYDIYGDGEDAEQIRAEIEKSLEEMPDDVTLNVLGLIDIDSIDCHFVVFDNDSVIDLRYGIGHHRSSVLPGEEGNCCLLGHHMRVEGMFFNKLIDVKIGDTVKITMLDGTEYIYVVDRTVVIDPMDLEYYVDGDDGTGRQITLVSCTYTGEGTMRILVIGHILEGED
ncbi:MAG: sortase [Clostridiales bacterium]|nr:sortase [Clostridiales bacterium]